VLRERGCDDGAIRLVRLARERLALRAGDQRGELVGGWLHERHALVAVHHQGRDGHGTSDVLRDLAVAEDREVDLLT
jgi:hypothetical protein